MNPAKTNPVTGYEVTLMPPNGEGSETFFGWVRLLNGDTDAGYVYITTPPETPRLSLAGVYIVTSVPPAVLGDLLNILRNEPELTIRITETQSEKDIPAVFIESHNGGIGGPGGFSISAEVEADVRRLRA